ncbi:Proteoglycan-4 [Trapelia coarctata]|nr:Proteoglycan-4 [Trapelia coarctata]
MDPASILTIAHGAFTITSQIILTLYAFSEDLKNLDDGIKCCTDEEVESLRRILLAITTSLNDPQLSLAAVSAGRYGNKDMWAAIYGSVEDCRLYLEKLRAELGNIRQGKAKDSFFRQAIRTVEMRLNKNQINQLRSHVRSHQLSLNTALQMLNVYICSRLPMQMQDRLTPQITNLSEAMAKLQVSIDSPASVVNNSQSKASSSQSGSPSSGSGTCIGSSSSPAQRLKQAAEKVRSNASEVSNARSTVWGGSERNFTTGSEWGEPLSQATRSGIEDWLSQPRFDEITEEAEASVKAYLLATSAPSQGERSASKSKLTKPGLIDSDGEDELAYEVVRKLLTRAASHYDNGNFTEAENIYRHALKRSHYISESRRSLLNIEGESVRLARACFKQRKFAVAKNLLLLVLKHPLENDGRASLILDASYMLGQIYISESDFPNAEMHCKRAVSGWRRICGKEAQETYNAIKLIIFLYSSDFAPPEAKYEAEAWSEMLPVQLRGTKCAIEYDRHAAGMVVKALQTLNGLDTNPPEDAEDLRLLVYNRTHAHSNVWTKFYDLLIGFYNKDSNPSEVVERVTELFKGQPELLEGFEKFHPLIQKVERSVPNHTGPSVVASDGTSTDTLQDAARLPQSREKFNIVRQPRTPKSHTHEHITRKSDEPLIFPEEIRAVLWDYEAQTDEQDSMTVKEGELVSVLEVGDNPDWWKVQRMKNMEEQGFVPSIYLGPQLEIARAKYDRRPLTAAEVSLRAGERVAILRVQNEEWSAVHRIWDGREGLVPSTYLEPYKPISQESNPGVSKAPAPTTSKEPTPATPKTPGPTASEEPIPATLNGSTPTTSKEPRPRILAKSDSTAPDPFHDNILLLLREHSNATEIPDGTSWRSWTDATGKFKTKARLLGCELGVVQLHQDNGIKIAVPLQKMSVKDLVYIGQLSWDFDREIQRYGSEEVKKLLRVAQKDRRGKAVSGDDSARLLYENVLQSDKL